MEAVHTECNINNSFFKDQRLSWKAKGILSYALTFPDGWNFKISDFTIFSSEGRCSISSALTELEGFGYLKRSQERENIGARFSRSQWIFCSSPNDFGGV